MSEYKASFEFDPFEETGLDLPRDKRADALEDIKNYVKEQVLSYVGEGKSPVSGGPWKKSLSKSYLKEKGHYSSSKIANLELHGDLLDSLKVEKVSGTTLELTVDSDQAGKAEGNNIGSYGKDADESKARRFIPIGDETFKRQIWSGIKDIIESYEN